MQVQLRKKFFPEWLTRVDLGAVYETNADEVKYVVGAKKSFELSDDGLLSLDVKASYRCVCTPVYRSRVRRLPLRRLSRDTRASEETASTVFGKPSFARDVHTHREESSFAALPRRTTGMGVVSRGATDVGVVALGPRRSFSATNKPLKGEAKGNMELSRKIFNFTEDQDLKMKIGAAAHSKMMYAQIRENNWTLNVDANGRWDVRYDL